MWPVFTVREGEGGDCVGVRGWRDTENIKVWEEAEGNAPRNGKYARKKLETVCTCH
jgi:hypothetical protein